MHILIVSELPIGSKELNYNGTQMVIGCLRDELIKLGHEVTIVTGDLLRAVPEGKFAYEHLVRVLDSTPFDVVHVVTQGRMGLMVRRYCVDRGLPFTAGYHTEIPEFLAAHHSLPAWISSAYIRWFLNAAACVLTPTESVSRALQEHGVRNVVTWPLGIDTERFRPRGAKGMPGMLGPIWLYVARVCPEKGIFEFLDLSLPGTKVVIGAVTGGLTLEGLRARYPSVHFLGVQTGEAHAQWFSRASVLIVPSRNETASVVAGEAAASGTPIVAHPVRGLVDVLDDPRVSILTEDLAAGAMLALKLDPDHCRDFALKRSWAVAAAHFLNLQVQCGNRESAAPVLVETDHWFYRVMFSLIGKLDRRFFPV